MKTLRRSNGLAAAFAAGAMLLAADGALAHSGDHGHGSDGSQMKSHDSKSDHSDKHSDKYKDKSGDMRSDKHKDKDSKHAEKMKEKAEKRAEKMKEKAERRAEKMKEKEEKQAEKMKDKDKDKTTTTSTTTANGTPAPGSDKDLFGKGIVGRTPTDIKPVPGTPASGTVPGPGATNAVRAVTISNGKGGSFQIPDHGAGVTVTSGGPGKLTISNGVQTQTVSGIAWTISGASGVAVDKSLGTGPRKADGSTTVLSPNGTVTGGGLPGDFQAYKNN
jgi:hypothetical protein